MKPMDDALDDFLERLDDGKPFALSRWGDGEYRLLEMIPLKRTQDQIEITNVWNFDPTNENERIAAKRITDSLTHEEEGLYWGISCPECDVCNVSGWSHYNMYENKENLTYANLFVNANHEEVQITLPTLLRNKTVAFVGNKEARIQGLPFLIDRHFGVGTNAWMNDLDILDDLKDYLSDSSGKVILFACGPLSNYLITELWKENKNHFLLDIGSCYDVEIYGRATRGFHRGNGGFGKTCQWIKIRDMEEDLDYFFERILNNESFALPRWGDGEYRLINSIPLKRNAEKNHVWTFDPTDEYQLDVGKMISDAISYECDNLFWGMPCPQCEVCNVSGQEQYENYKNKDNLTFVNLFVNANHEEVQRTLPNLLRGKTIAFVGNKSAKINQLPFHVDRHFPVSNNAWLNDLNILEDLRDYVRDLNTKPDEPPAILLFASGPLSCYLITELWKENKEHFLIDIGSAFDVNIYNRPTRDFHSGKGGFGKTCQWMEGINTRFDK